MALCDIRAEELAETERACRRVGASRVECRVIDVSNEGEVQAFCEALDEVDCLVNTVGIVDCFGDAEELPLDEWERVMRVNVTSALLTAKYSVPLMRERGGGAIINISSASGLANQVRKRVFLRHFMLKMIILPRQARDKHRESTQKKDINAFACIAGVYPPDLCEL